MNLGKAIKLCRNHIGISQAELARRAEISVSYLSLLEKNKRDANMGTVERLAHSMGLPVSLLVFLASDKEDLTDLDDETIDRLKLTALRVIDASSKEPGLL